ncbi:MAG: hypothetical protein NZ839_03650 [Endomicrobia bacterium]|nr:hypothetical protein [Endomicrobiia bacterium]
MANAKQVQFRRGTTSQHQSFVGVIGEITVDTDKKVVVVHDGITYGGHPMQKEIKGFSQNENGDINITNNVFINGKLIFKIPVYDYNDFLQNAENRQLGIIVIDGSQKLVIKLNNEIIVLGG